MPNTSEHPPTAPGLTLTEFLLARIADDEGAARGLRGQRFRSARAIAECEAKRRIVEEHSPPVAWTGYSDPDDPDDEPMVYEPEPYQASQCRTCGYAEEWQVRDYGATFPCATLKLLAAVYADHPDYREEWKP